jgi:hypothetical protein
MFGVWRVLLDLLLRWKIICGHCGWNMQSFGLKFVPSQKQVCFAQLQLDKLGERLKEQQDKMVEEGHTVTSQDLRISTLKSR